MEALSKKYGPLPGSVWLLLVFVGVFILIKSRQAKAKSGTGPGGTTSTSAGTIGNGNTKTTGTSSVTNSTFNMGAGSGGGSYEQYGGQYNQSAPSNSFNTAVNGGITTTTHQSTNVDNHRTVITRRRGDHGRGGWNR